MTDTPPPGTEIRLVTADERLDLAMPLTRYAFEASPSEPDLEALRARLAVSSQRAHVLLASGTPSACAGVLPMVQNVRGARLSMGGVAGVATHPGFRRRGHARALLRHVLADMRDQGHAVSALYPFRPSFYQRFGYVGLPQGKRVALDPRDLAPLVRADLPGEVTLSTFAEVAADARDFFERMMDRTHGMALRDDPGLGQLSGVTDQWAAVARRDGAVSGLLAYRVTRYGGELDARWFLHADPVSRSLLLAHVGRHADQVAAASLPLGPGDRPETWVTDADLTFSGRAAPLHAPSPMVRILSVPALSGIAAGDGRVAVRVVDDLIGGDYELTGSGGRLAVTAGTGVPPGTELTELTGHGLAALVFGVLDPDELALRGFGRVAGADTAALRSLFPPADPFLWEQF